MRGVFGNAGLSFDQADRVGPAGDSTQTQTCRNTCSRCRGDARKMRARICAASQLFLETNESTAPRTSSFRPRFYFPSFLNVIISIPVCRKRDLPRGTELRLSVVLFFLVVRLGVSQRELVFVCDAPSILRQVLITAIKQQNPQPSCRA